MHDSAVPTGISRGNQIILKLKLQVIASCPVWVLGELSSSARAHVVSSLHPHQEAPFKFMPLYK